MYKWNLKYSVNLVTWLLKYKHFVQAVFCINLQTTASSTVFRYGVVLVDLDI